MGGYSLTLRTTLSMSELADHVTHLLWDFMTRQPGARRLDAHRFPGLSRAIDGVLLQHFGACLVSPYDAWARTGGEREAGLGKPAVCRDHQHHLLAEAGRELEDLFADLEKAISQFLFRHQPERAKFNHGVADSIHRAITESIAPYLYQNIAASCCTEQAA